MESVALRWYQLMQSMYRRNYGPVCMCAQAGEGSASIYWSYTGSHELYSVGVEDPSLCPPKSVYDL